MERSPLTIDSRGMNAWGQRGKLGVGTGRQGGKLREVFRVAEYMMGIVQTAVHLAGQVWGSCMCCDGERVW